MRDIVWYSEKNTIDTYNNSRLMRKESLLLDTWERGNCLNGQELGNGLIFHTITTTQLNRCPVDFKNNKYETLKP